METERAEEQHEHEPVADAIVDRRKGKRALGPEAEHREKTTCCEPAGPSHPTEQAEQQSAERHPECQRSQERALGLDAPAELAAAVALLVDSAARRHRVRHELKAREARLR